MTTERVEVAIPVDAGRAVLAGDVLLPPGDAPHPVVVSLYPYRKDDIIGSLFAAPRARLAEAGLASLLVDMRGHGASSGSPGVAFDLGGTEGSDAAEVVEWAAAQPWCSGEVGIWGVSYGGMTALAAAAKRPPHLRAAAAVYATNDAFADVIAPGGSPVAFGRYSWSAHMLALDLCPPTRQDADGAWRRVWRERLERMRARPGHAFEWQQHAADADYWRPRVAEVAAITVPTFLIGGWHDYFADATVRVFSQISAPKQMVIGPWLHVVPDLADREPYDWVGELSTWFARYLVPGAGTGRMGDAAGRARDRPEVTGAGQASSALVYVGGARTWRRYAAWPPSEASGVVMHLCASGRLDPGQPAEAGAVAYRPTALTGQQAGMFEPLGTGFGRPDDQHSDDLASLTFETAALEEPLEVAGCPEAELALDLPEGLDLRLVVKLCDVAEDGHSKLLATGWRQVPALTGPATGARVSVHCGPVAAVLERGHRLRVAVSSADFPRHWPTPTVAGFSVACGGALGSYVVLPVMPHDATAECGIPEVPRPPAVSRPDWVRAGASSYRRTREEPGGVAETVVASWAELAPPNGSLLAIDERFTARASASDPALAKVRGEISIAVTLADGEDVQVIVDAEFGVTSASASGRVLADGVTVFEERWAAGQGPPDGAGPSGQGHRRG